MGSSRSHLRARARLTAAASPRVAWVCAYVIPVTGMSLRITQRRRAAFPYLKRNPLTLPMLVVPSEIKEIK